MLLYLGYRGKDGMMKVFNDPSYQRNATFLCMIPFLFSMIHECMEFVNVYC